MSLQTAMGLLMACATFSQTAVAQQVPTDDGPPDFNRQVRPILAKHCYACHGMDDKTREADLRLDTLDGSRQAIEPGDPEASEVWLRVISDDEDLRMPPADAHPALDQNSLDILKRWIESGAEYELHWALRPTRTVSVPLVNDKTWPRGPIDCFILSRLEAAGLSPASPAAPTALLRRVYMDLIGVPPTPEQADRFAADPSDTHYQQIVDHLLASPQYGERFARPWLDLARYSDTNGYEKDRPRTIWPYRNWVIDAINQDMPFDQFSIEQLAGDMLPDATEQQRIATGFHRNTMLNEEGGIDPLEYRFYAMVDRVATTGTVWMGLTTVCAQCHTHKFDPITHHDYYALMALMDSADEPEMNADSPQVISQRKQIQEQIANLEEQTIEQLDLLDAKTDKPLASAYATWKHQQLSQTIAWATVPPQSMKSTMPRLETLADGSVLASGDATKRDVYTLTMPPLATDDPITAIRIEALAHPSLPSNGPGLAFYEGRRGDFFLSEIRITTEQGSVELDIGSTSVPNAKKGNGKTFPGNVLDENGSTGWSIPGGSGQSHRLVLPLKQATRLDQPWTIELLFERHYVAGLGHFRIDVTGDKNPAASALPSDLQFELAQSPQPLPADLDQQLATQYLRLSPAMAEQRKPIDQLRRRLPGETRTLVMKQRPADFHRETMLRHRGEYLQAREVVPPRIPTIFQRPHSKQPSDRLELAQWLVSDGNPLVGRVTANRSWRLFFGSGIVQTAGDFGTQSLPPTHPDLIDYLDARLRDRSPRGDAWSLKRLHREIVLSATYRQAVGSPPDRDPDNQLLSVFPYHRYDAERIRDSMLRSAGLLSQQVGGPSVYPPQPKAVVALAWGNAPWPVANGANRYRRSLYTFSKRTAPFAAAVTFDAPSGEQCLARRDSSTTPLQALTLLNDAMFVEIAGKLAEDTLRECRQQTPNPSPEQIASTLFRRVLIRQPSDDELKAFVDFFQQQSQHPNPWMLVARVLLNTDEAITTP